MVIKKRSKIEAMSKLNSLVGRHILASLVTQFAFLITDHNGNSHPHQILIDLSGEPLYDSRINGTIPYECFEEVKDIDKIEKKGLQTFYRLKQSYSKEYRKYMKNK